MKKNRFRLLVLGLALLLALPGPGCRPRIPVKVPVRAPVRVPVKAPAEPPVRAPVGAPELPGPKVEPLPRRALVAPDRFGMPAERAAGGEFRVRTGAAERVSLAKSARTLEEIHTLGLRRDWRGLKIRAREEMGTQGQPRQLQQNLAKAFSEATRLESLDRLQKMVTQPREKLPAVEQIEQDLADFLGAGGDPRLTARTQQYLAYKAAWEGDLDAAKELLPPVPPEDAGTRLRDLTSIVLGDSDPASRIPGDLGGGKHRPPALGSVPIPEAGPEGFRPGVKESAQSGLPPLEGEPGSRRPLRSLKAEIREQIEESLRRMHGHLHVVHEYGQMGRAFAQEEDEEKEQGKTEQAVAKCLGRDLTAAERILVRQMQRRGMKPPEMAAILNRLPARAP